jgi:hypothetical protein
LILISDEGKSRWIPASAIVTLFASGDNFKPRLLMRDVLTMTPGCL